MVPRNPTEVVQQIIGLHQNFRNMRIESHESYERTSTRSLKKCRGKDFSKVWYAGYYCECLLTRMM